MTIRCEWHIIGAKTEEGRGPAHYELKWENSVEIASLLHNIGVTFGFGGAVVSAALMLRLRTDEQRLHRGHLARRIALVTWCGLIFLILSGINLTLNYPSGYTLLFGVKHVCVAIILVDALFIHFRFFPRYFRDIGTADFGKTYSAMRRIGTLSVTCWIIVLVLSI